MNKHLSRSSQKGFLEVIVIVLIALILLRFLGIDIDAILGKQPVRDFFRFSKDILVQVWNDLLKIITVWRSS